MKASLEKEVEEYNNIVRKIAQLEEERLKKLGRIELLQEVIDNDESPQ